MYEHQQCLFKVFLWGYLSSINSRKKTPIPSCIKPKISAASARNPYPPSLPLLLPFNLRLINLMDHPFPLACNHIYPPPFRFFSSSIANYRNPTVALTSVLLIFLFRILASGRLLYSGAHQAESGGIEAVRKPICRARYPTQEVVGVKIRRQEERRSRDNGGIPGGRGRGRGILSGYGRGRSRPMGDGCGCEESRRKRKDGKLSDCWIYSEFEYHCHFRSFAYSNQCKVFRLKPWFRSGNVRFRASHNIFNVHLWLGSPIRFMHYHFHQISLISYCIISPNRSSISVSSCFITTVISDNNHERN